MPTAQTGTRPAAGVPTMGVEEEFFLVGADGRLAPRSVEVLDAAPPGPGELLGEFTRSQVEAAGPVCAGAGELLAGLRESRRRLAEAAARLDTRVIAGAVPVMAELGPQQLNPGTRYHRIAERFGAVAEAAGTNCGCHVHVEVPDRDSGVQAGNRLRAWLPTLLALSANSPVCGGTDTGYGSWRQPRWSRWPTAGPPPPMESAEHYEHCVAALLESGAALDRRMLYWDIRLSDRHPTVEIRVCDVPATPEESALIAVLVRALVAAALDDAAQGRPAPRRDPAVLRGDLWRAARDGLEGSCPDPLNGGRLRPVHGVLAGAVEHLRPYLERSGDLGFAQAVLTALRAHGGGAARQRVSFNRRSLAADVVDDLAYATAHGLEASVTPPGRGAASAHARPFGG
ncbi:carboxylate-amine ligase [Streptomonospora litoralis]|uniref:Putative glutamate--cysteine ligase 2 n=1 Tax=Streptomonospora litoralis TaxID=2498135 RepID=A0A4P6Q2K2_9ACTN|nr:glutamate--cysteine ligase [Streptomonospora litoralis]QBI54785.1 Carboxylate-amine ligase YbdK [Streptomonospora litoralis]